MNKYLQIAMAVSGVIFIAMMILWVFMGWSGIEPIQFFSVAVVFLASLGIYIYGIITKKMNSSSTHLKMMYSAMQWWEDYTKGIYGDDKSGSGEKLVFDGSISDSRRYDDINKSYKAFYFKRQSNMNPIIIIWCVEDNDVARHFADPATEQYLDPFASFKPCEPKKYKPPKEFTGSIPVGVTAKEDETTELDKPPA